MNINEIARLAGVSRATVSRYLNNGYVSSEKKEVIRRVIQETGYQPSSQAQTLRTKKTSLIGVILPKINSDTISREVTGISDILTRRGYQLILANTNNDVEEELKYLSLFKERQVDGVVFIATMFTRKHKQMLKDYKVPIVILGQHLDGYPCIYQDDHKAAFQVTEKLAEKGKKFAYIGVTDKDEAVGACRKKGFMDAIHKAKLEVVPERMKIGSFTMDSGYEMAKELFEEEPSIDSLVCATDTMAVGAMTYLKEIGLRIPEDVQIAGIGDGVPGKIVEPKLTTVHFYYKTSGMEAAAMLADLIENDTGISKEITGISQVTENILADRGRNYKLLWNRSRSFGRKRPASFLCGAVLWLSKHRKMPDFFCDTLTGLSVLHLFLWNMYNFDRRNLCDVADLQIIMQ